MPSLPRIAGEGAAGETAALHTLLAEHPAFMARVALAERVGQRRWRLRLAEGSTVELPAHGEAEAIARALRAPEAVKEP
jgi:cell division protein FtsQ